MLNVASTVDPELLKVLDYSDPRLERAMANGQVNTTDDQILANICSAIRRGHPQIRPCPPKTERVCLVGSGPSLNETLPELRELYFQGAHVVTMNGAYHWCLDHNIRPSTQIVLDARVSNARFLEPAVPQCRYVLASQCAPEAWDAVDGREHVWIFHAAAGSDGAIAETLDAYYHKQWIGIGGGVTVASRAIMLLRMVGYLRMDLFGVDSCWLDGAHHAFDQPENAHDKRFRITIAPTGHPEQGESFLVSPWHQKQLEDMIAMVRVNGDQFLLNVHGRGVLARALAMLASSDDASIDHSVSEE